MKQLYSYAWVRASVCLLVTGLAAACGRDASEGKIGVQVDDFRAVQPLALRDSTAMTLAPAESSHKAALYLAPSDTPASELGRINRKWTRYETDEDGLAECPRVEGEYYGVVDRDGDGTSDAVVPNLQPGDNQRACITHDNQRKDGAWLQTTNDRVQYRTGDEIVIHVTGWVPASETITVQIWNARSGGFLYWESEPRTIEGEIDFEIRHIIPNTWPLTNDPKNGAYFSYPSSGGKVFNGDNFVLLDGRDPGDEDDEGDDGDDDDDQIAGTLIVAEGAAAVSSLTVPLSLASGEAQFMRLSNTAENLEVTPWVSYTESVDAWSLAPGADGERTVFAQFASALGITSAVVTDTVILDTTPIEIIDLAVNRTLVRAGQTLVFTYTLSEPAAQQTLSFAGQLHNPVCTNLSCTLRYTVTGSEGDGTESLVITVRDQVGWQASDAIAVMLDFTPPDTGFATAMPAGLTTSTTLQVNLTSTEADSTYQCSIDGAPYAACTSSFTLTGLSQGAHTLLARAIDPVGNVDPTPASASFTVNSIAPDTLLTSTPAVQSNDADASLAFSSPDSDVAGYECSLDGAAYTSCVSPASYLALADGAHSFAVRAVDIAGNVDASPALWSWSIDTVAPDTTVEALAACTQDNNPLIAFSSEDTQASFECSLDGAAYSTCASPLAPGLLADGEHTLAVRAVDSYGNTDSAPAERSWTVDTLAPAAPQSGLLHLLVRAKGISDQLTGDAGAVEATSTVQVYGDANLLFLATAITADASGGFTAIDIGDDLGDADELVYVTASDCAGNASLPTAVLNPRVPPKVSGNSIVVVLATDGNTNGIGNPGDTLRVTWDNSPGGDDNQDITSVVLDIPLLGVTAATMAHIGGQLYRYELVLPVGNTDEVVKATVTAARLGGLSSAPKTSSSGVSVDNEPPAAPGVPVFPSINGTLEINWAASAASDVVSYAARYGLVNVTDRALPLTTATTISVAISECTSFAARVKAIDDAGNYSDDSSMGTSPTAGLAKPIITAWGGIQSINYTLSNIAGAQSVDLHFAKVTESAGSPPWNGYLKSGVTSPVPAIYPGNGRLEILSGGVEYRVAVVAQNGVCTSDPSDVVTVRTLGVADTEVGGITDCWYGLDCNGGSMPWGRFNAGLGFAVATVGDIIGNDGREDVLTGAPGIGAATLVSGSDLTVTEMYNNYYVSRDVIAGGGPTLAALGDVSGDGVPDYVVGSPLESAAGKSVSGRIRVYDGSQPVTDGNQWITAMWEMAGDVTGRQLGYAVSNIGDITGDGKNDLIVGGHGCRYVDCSSPTDSVGKVWVLSGADGSVLHVHSGENKLDFYGVSVHGGVDLTNDGKPDYVVGAPGAPFDESRTGAVYVYSGSDHSLIRKITSSDMSRRFGAAVKMMPRSYIIFPFLYTDRILIGAPSKDDDISGQAFMYLSTNLFGINTVTELNADVAKPKQYFGLALAGSEDIDGDGKVDIVVGDPNVPLSAAYGAGHIMIFNESGLLRYEIKPSELVGALGYAIDYIADINSDGVSELVVGAPGSELNDAYDSGAIYFVTGKPAP